MALITLAAVANYCNRLQMCQLLCASACHHGNVNQGINIQSMWGSKYKAVKTMYHMYVCYVQKHYLRSWYLYKKLWFDRWLVYPSTKHKNVSRPRESSLLSKPNSDSALITVSPSGRIGCGVTQTFRERGDSCLRGDVRVIPSTSMSNNCMLYRFLWSN